MLVRRTSSLWIELVEEPVFDLQALLSATPTIPHRQRWLARTPHRDGSVEVDLQDLALLAACAAVSAVPREALEARFGAERVARLLDERLLRDASTDAPEQDAPLTDWHPLAAISHRHLRWRGQDARRAVAEMESRGADLLEVLGPAPPLSKEHPHRLALIPLAATDGDASTLASPLEALALARATCRNFAARPLPLPLFSSLMRRVYAAQSVSQPSGVAVMKRPAASAGGLHAIEAYVLVQSVEGLVSGLYHYLPVSNSLELLRRLEAGEARALATRAVAGQDWFATAPAMVVLAARFRRNHWKYRRHAKTLRALTLDAGHLSHHQYLVATELGLGAFITAAINEGDIEDAFGLDPMQEGVLAVTGFGWRGERMEVLEFDPLQQVWPEWSSE